VLVRGESGSGKELVARAIYRASPRWDRPLLAVNCAAIPENLVESQLFGHKKGSFTGATQDRKGWFQQADTGTLFLDEIGELPLEAQAKLLRILDGHPFLPVGATEETSTDVRIIAATNRDLRELVRAKRFREDLYYRINVIELQVPPLRDRDSDVLILCDKILARIASEMQLDLPRLDSKASAMLCGYRVPGNVRELENILERAGTMCENNMITADDIQIKDSERETQQVETPDLGDRLEDMERTTIMKALEETRFNKTAAAKKLGLTLRALRYRIQKLDIE